MTLNYFLRGDQYSKPEQIVGFDTQLLEKVRHLPGVQAAGLTNVVPGDGYYGNYEVRIPEHPAEAPESFRGISHGRSRLFFCDGNPYPAGTVLRPARRITTDENRRLAQVCKFHLQFFT